MTHSPKNRVTKKGQLIRLLGTKSGSDIRSLSVRLGWQQHSTRAALSGLREAGYKVACEKPATGGLAKYRILSAPASQQGKTATVSARGA